MDPSGPDPANRAHAALARDAALTRVSHTRRWVILGSAGLSAGFAALVSASPPSHASTTSAKSIATPAVTPSPSAGSRSKKAPLLPPLASGSALGLASPSQAPSQSAAPPDSGSQGQSQSAPSGQAAPSQQQAAPSPQPGPVSGGS